MSLRNTVSKYCASHYGQMKKEQSATAELLDGTVSRAQQENLRALNLKEDRG